MEKYLSSGASIIHLPKFESAIVKIQEQFKDSLDSDDKYAICSLLVQPNVETPPDGENQNFAVNILKKQKL